MNECWNRSENLINRKISIFCIETIPKKNLNSEKSAIFFRVKKKTKNKNDNFFQHAMRPAPRILKRNPNGI